jgi:hypothetical protein
MKEFDIQYETKITAQNLLKMPDSGIYGPIPLPFDFPFFGKNYKQVWISGSGVLLFEEPKTTTSLFNITKLPRDNDQETLIGPAFCPLWESMQAGACEADMAYSVNDRSFGVLWGGVPISGMVYKKNYFSAWIYSTGVMEVFYDNVYVRSLEKENSILNGVVGVIDHTRKRGMTSKLLGSGNIEKTAIRFEPEESDFIDAVTQVKPVLDPFEAMKPKEPVIVAGDTIERTIYVPDLNFNINLKIRGTEE